LKMFHNHRLSLRPAFWAILYLCPPRIKMQLPWAAGFPGQGQGITQKTPPVKNRGGHRLPYGLQHTAS